jgi:hypothetical protein
LNVLNVESFDSVLSKPTGAASPFGVLNAQALNEVHVSQVVPSQLPLPIRGTNMSLVWSDEFEGTDVDPTKWNKVGPWGHPVSDYPSTNNFFSYDSANVSVANSILSIRAHKTTGSNWTGGIVSTDNYTTGYPGANWTYGFFECRAQMPVLGQGFWPAIWMLAYANSTEFDILEWIGAADPFAAIQTVHYSGSSQNDHPNISTISTAFHKYQMWWRSNGVFTYYIDDVQQGQWTGINAPWPMWFMLNFDVGGTQWPGDPDSTTPSPAYFQVDYVRVYQ